MTKLEKILLAATAVFFVLAVALLPRNGGAAVRAEPAFALPGPTPDASPVPGEVYIDLTRRIELNSADARELTLLPGVGPVTAEAIVSYRETHGPFLALEELLLVPEVSESVYAAILEAVESSAGSP